MVEQSPYARWVGSVLGSYHLEQLQEQSALGPVFLGRERAANAAVRIRLLNVPPAQTPDLASTYRRAVEHEAAPCATLRHPYILPLTDFGVHQGLPYLVWPHLVMRPLSARLAQSGPMDVVTTGRYLDQIAAALETAHAADLLHGNLSADCVYMQLDGQPVVADFSVRPLLEVLGPAENRRPFYGSLEACAPEQLRNGPLGPSTDTYALGALVYRLLTGHPVFSAPDVDALLQQHLLGAVPPLYERRDGLPGALDRVFATALAKDPAARFPTPGAFADAYHEVVSAGRGTRVPFASRAVSSRMPASRPPQRSRPPTRSTGSPLGSLPPLSTFDGDADDQTIGGTRGEPSPSRIRDERANNPASAAVATNARRGGLATLARKPANIIATVLLLVLLASGGVFILGGGNIPLLLGGHPSGLVEFVDGANGPPGHTDALHISATGLPTPPQGSRYYGWILNQLTERTVPLGALAGSTGGSYTLTYAGDGAQGRAGTNLLTLGDKLEVTLERGDVPSPFGSVALAATMPPKAGVHIQHLLVAFPTTPSNIGLLVGLLEQTQALDAQAALLHNAQTNKNPTGVQCGAQSIINIIEGSNGTNYRPLGPSCQAQSITQAGDGFGLLGPLSAPSDPYAGSTPGGYLADATDHASLAATQPDATSNIRTHAAHVETAITNITGWVTTADRDALALLKAPTNTAAAADLVTLCDHAYHGVTATSDQQVNPVPGQAGAITAYEHGQFMATLTLSPGK